MLRHLINIVLGCILGHAVYANCIGIRTIDVVGHRVILEEAPSVPLWLYAAIGLLLVYAADECLRRQSAEAPFVGQRALAPLLVLLPFSFFATSMLSPIVFSAVVAICVVRVTANLPEPRDLRWLHPSLFIVLALGIVSYFTMLQLRALDSMYLNYSDWAIYLNVVDNTINGRWFYSNELGRNYMGHHFIPGMVLLLAPMLAAFRTAAPYFLMNALVLHGGVLILYAFARRLQIRRPVAVAVVAGALFYPSLSQMTMSIYYGFHPLHLTMPLIAVFVLLCERRGSLEKGGRLRLNTILLGIVFVLTLAIKETVPVFFGGLGVVYFLLGRRRLGFVLAAASIVYFLIVIMFVIPGISGLQEYEFTNRYHHLGDSISAIALSPFLEPDTFFGALFRPHNIYFILLLLLPVFVAAFSKPVYLIAAVPTLMFVCLQSSTQQANIVLQYQCEVVMLLLTATVVGLTAGESNRWCRALGCGMPRLPGAAALCAGVVVATLLAHFFFGLGYLGKNNSQYLLHAPGYSDSVEELRERLDGRAVSATPRLGAHLVFTNDTYLVLSEDTPQNLVVLDLDDEITERPEFETYRWRLNSSAAYGVETMVARDRNWLVYERLPTPQTEREPAFKRIDDSRWSELGTAIEVRGRPQLEARVVSEKSEQQERIYEVAIRFNEPVSSDMKVSLHGIGSIPGSRIPVQSDQRHFGDGTLPAFLAAAGDVWTTVFKLQVSPNVEIGELSIVTTPKFAPDLSRPPFE